MYSCVYVRACRCVICACWNFVSCTNSWSQIVPDSYQNTNRNARENLKPSFYALLSRASCEFHCNGLLLFSYDFFLFFSFFFFIKLHERLREPRGQNVRLPVNKCSGLTACSRTSWAVMPCAHNAPLSAEVQLRRRVRNEVAKDANETRGKKWRRSKRVQPEESRTAPNWRVNSAVAAFGLCLSTHQTTIFICWEVNAC